MKATRVTPKFTDEEVEELSSEARMLLNSRVFSMALEDLQGRYVQCLLTNDVGSLTATTAHASMKVLDDVRGALQAYINEAAMRNRK